MLWMATLQMLVVHMFLAVMLMLPLQGGSGSGAKATFNITGTSTISGNITNGGSGGTDNSYPFVQLHNTPVQTFVVTSIVNPMLDIPGEPNAIYVIDGVTQPTLNIVPGNTYCLIVGLFSTGF